MSIRKVPLRKCGSWLSGGTPEKSNDDYWGGKIPWISGKSIKEFYIKESGENVTEVGVKNGTTRVGPGTVLILVRGMSLTDEIRVGITKRPVAFNQDVKGIRPAEGVEPLYLANAIRASEPQLLSLVDEASHGTGRLQTDTLGDFEIPLPPLPVQRRIADILGALDDKIELNRRMNETLEEMAQALYQHWFVDFGPFQDREFTDTEELGPIPEGWQVAPLETIVNIELDNIDPQDHPEEEFDYYSFSAYDDDQYPEIEVGGEIGSRKSLVKRRKVMVSRLNPGDYRIWTVYPDGERRGITSTEFIHFVPVRESLWGYLNCHLRSEGFKVEFRRHASGTTGSRQRVRRRTPNEFKTAIPPETVLNEFGEKVNPIWDLIHSNRKENQQLSETRDYLLPKLISGEIEVDAAEKAVKANV